MQDDDGQIIESHSISAGLDYPGVGPEHSRLATSGRARYIPITDTEAMNAFRLLCQTEGIIPAIESAHAVAAAVTYARERGCTSIDPDTSVADLTVAAGRERWDADTPIVIINLSGRGDKDVDTAAKWFDLVPDEEKLEEMAETEKEAN